MSEMTEKCPVCKTVCKSDAKVCFNCEFSDEQGISGRVILEEMQLWLETKVKPYREKWEAKKRETKLLEQLEAAKQMEEITKKRETGLLEQLEAVKQSEKAAKKRETELMAKIELAQIELAKKPTQYTYLERDYEPGKKHTTLFAVIAIIAIAFFIVIMKDTIIAKKHVNNDNENYREENYDKAVKQPSQNIAIEQKPSVNIITDSRDGKKYKTVKIGNKVWMAENLNYNASDSKCYGNLESNCKKYGKLYSWNTAMKACPSGWHLPSNAEWNALYRFTDGNSDTESPYKSETAGKQLKAATGWNLFNGISGNGEDIYGFAALPGGSSYLGVYDHIGNNSYWWSTSEYESDKAYYRFMLSENTVAGWNRNSKKLLLSVRCIKN